MDQNELLLELKLGKKILPIRVRDENQKLVFQQAEARINKKMDYYRTKYNINDESAFYLMICLDFVTDLIQSEKELNKLKEYFERLSFDLEQALELNLQHENLSTISDVDSSDPPKN